MMRLPDAIAVLHEHRDDQIVVTTMGAAREWMKLGSHPLDFVYVPSSMGQATSIGLGLALAQPDRRVVVCNGDGSQLMNLGSLVTLAAHPATNLTVVLFDNQAFEVTGSQLTAAADAIDGRQGRVDWMGLARSAGIRNAFRFDNQPEWNAGVETVLNQPGPVFVQVPVTADPEATGPRSPGPGPARARAFRDAVLQSSGP